VLTRDWFKTNNSDRIICINCKFPMVF
jgi:hypothetical protein